MAAEVEHDDVDKGVDEDAFENCSPAKMEEEAEDTDAVVVDAEAE